MIVELSVENIAIIERAHVALGPGFTVLTGETGAGKSLLIDAIELALGERADFDLVRSGARTANVSVAIDLSHRPDLLKSCEEMGIPLEGSMLYIQRELMAEGRSQCRVGGKLVPVNSLRQLGTMLVDLHGQHDHQALLHPERHVEYLDLWIGAPASHALAQVATAHARAQQAKAKLDSIRAGMREREYRLDLLRFQVNEIESAGPQPRESEELQGQLTRLQHAEKLANAAFAALEVLSDGEVNSVDLLASVTSGLGAVERYDGSLSPVVEGLNESLVQLREAAHELSAYAEGLDADPAQLEEIAGRLDVLKRLHRKYGGAAETGALPGIASPEEEVLAFLDRAKSELSLLESADESEEELAMRHEAARTELLKVSNTLTALRQERALEFDRLVAKQLGDLGMERSIFRTEMISREPDATGADDIQFFFSANAGEPEKPLSKIASGGEISRVMLAIKSAFAGRAGVPTLIFDEVDAGLGGRAAATVAAKIEELAAHYQVLVISHLPQIASRAASHYRIEKAESNGRVVAQVRRLNDQERVEEVARMLAGELVTNSALENAREMLTR